MSDWHPLRGCKEGGKAPGGYTGRGARPLLP